MNHYMGNTKTNTQKPQKDVTLLEYKFFQSHIRFTDILMLESSASKWSRPVCAKQCAEIKSSLDKQCNYIINYCVVRWQIHPV